MKTQEARSFAEKALDQLAAALDRGESDAMKAYLATMAKFWRYSWGNQLLIAMQRPHATRVAGYQAWKILGRQVRKGEKGMMILAPIVYRSRQGRSNEDDGDTDGGPIDMVAVRPVGFRATYVFDVAQTDGEPLPELERVEGDPQDYLDRLKAFVTERGITLAYSGQLGGAYGMSAGGRIVLRSGLMPAEELAVLAHEAAHELMHQDTVTRPASKTVRETEAEAVAFVICQAIGLQTGNACSDYIRIWSGDKAVLATSLERIRRTAAFIIDGIQVAVPPAVGAAA